MQDVSIVSSFLSLQINFSKFQRILAFFRLEMALNGLKIKVKLFLTLISSKKSCRITFLALQWMICQDINKSELWVFEEISRKLQNSKNSHKNFCPNFWDRHRGSFFLFFHPDNESSEKKTFAEGGYGSTVSYPTNAERGT